MKHCDNCSSNNADNAKYCINCGYELPKPIITENTETPVAPAPSGKRSKPALQIIGALVGILVMFSIQHFVRKSYIPDIDDATMQIASEINKSCPLMVDSETRMDNITALPNHIFMYNYTLINYELGAFDTTEIKKQLEPLILNFVKTSPQMKQIRELKFTLLYHYKDKNGKYLFQITATPQQYE